MRVVLQKDCLGGERVVELELPSPVARGDLDRLASRGKLLVLDDLPRPFFRLDVSGEFLLTGILSSSRIRVTVRLAQRSHALDVALNVAEWLQRPPS